MTATESCHLVVRLTRELAAVRRDGVTSMLLAQRLAFRLADVAKALAVERKKYRQLLEERHNGRQRAL